MKKTFTTAFNRTPDFVRKVNCVEFTAPSKVKASLSYATDINQIYENYCHTGKLPLNGKQPLYDENYIKYDSLIEAQKLVSEASAYFEGLPANIKNQYGNHLDKFILALNKKDDFLVKNGVLNLPTEKPVDDTLKSVDEKLPVNPENSVNESLNTAQTD